MRGAANITPAPIQPVTTARILSAPRLFSGEFPLSRSLLVILLSLIIITGFGFRIAALSFDGLSEDELNKLRAVEDYRQNGLTSSNGEHPMLMKALLTMSVVAAEALGGEKLNGQGSEPITVETALRFPGALAGALTSLLIFLVARELFGVSVAIIASALWAFDPSAIGFNRIAKEDTFLLFFFLLANVFWLRGQRIAENGGNRPQQNYWWAAASFGAMLASKYIPHYLAISTSYYYAFQGVPSARWRLGKRKWLVFFMIMGGTFLLCNPTILLPATWQEMRIFASEKRVGHDAYEFMGHLYRNQMSLWLKGSPWYFYFVFIAFKTPITVLAGLLWGLPLACSKKLGDGRFFLGFWALFWFLPFTFLGGKFTRYYTFALPLVLMIAAIGIKEIAAAITRQLPSEFLYTPQRRSAALAVIILIFILHPVIASATIAPFYRLYTNPLGGGDLWAGSYFPHDEFYDASLREAAFRVAKIARQGARVASETPELFSFYAQRAQRRDLISISLSEKNTISNLQPGDVIIVARGRRYFSNDQTLNILRAKGRPFDQIRYGPTTDAVEMYLIDEDLQSALREGCGNK